MSILRDCIARFTVQVDTKPLTDLDRKMDKARKTVNSMAKEVAYGLAGAAYSVYKFVDAASHADEILNVLDVVFKENSKSVQEWSKIMGTELGRSEYALQDATSKFGAFLDPIFKNTDKDITNMSEQLSALAVDLASFYNTSDEEAQMRLFSGISGETEAVRRLGIDISDSSLRQMHEKSGAPGQYKSLSMADKTWLRFQKIIQDTTNAQGDSARTAQGWANSLKRLQGKWQTFTVDMGRSIKDYLLPLLHEVETWVPVMSDAIKKSDLLGSSLRLTGLAVGTLTAAFVALNAPALLMGGVLATLLAGFEDLSVFLDGGDSSLGEFMKDVSDTADPLNSWEKGVDNAVGSLDVLTGAIMDAYDNIRSGRFIAGKWEQTHTKEAKTRALQRSRNEAGRIAGEYKAREEAAAAGDLVAFQKTYAGHTTSEEQLANDYKNFRRLHLGQGGTANMTDVADGLVSKEWLVKQAQDTYGPMTEDQLAAMQQLAAERAQSELNITIHVDKLDSENKETAKKFLEETARQLDAIMKERK